jgi:hypothetical protein
MFMISALCRHARLPVHQARNSFSAQERLSVHGT